MTTTASDNNKKSDFHLDIRSFSKHVTKVGPQRAFMDFLYGMFCVADAAMRDGHNGQRYVKPQKDNP